MPFNALENHFAHCKLCHSKYKHLHFIASLSFSSSFILWRTLASIQMESLKRTIVVVVVVAAVAVVRHSIELQSIFILSGGMFVSRQKKKLRLLFILPFAKSEQLLRLMPSPAIWIENNINILSKRKTSPDCCRCSFFSFFFFVAFISVSSRKANARRLQSNVKRRERRRKKKRVHGIR